MRQAASRQALRRQPGLKTKCRSQRTGSVPCAAFVFYVRVLLLACQDLVQDNCGLVFVRLFSQCQL